MEKQEMAIILKNLREKAGFTQEYVASKLGKSNPTISSWETGRGSPDALSLVYLCNLYGISSLSELSDGVTDDENEAWFRFTAQAKAEGVNPDDLRLALDFIKQSRKQFSEGEN